MKIFMLILLLAGLGYIGYQLKEEFGGPLKDALNIEDPASEEKDVRAIYQSKLGQLEKKVFAPLSGSSRTIQTDSLLRQLSLDAEAERISRTGEAQIRRRITALQQALQERNRFAAEYRSITQSKKRSFDEDVKSRRIKLQQEDIERRWAEASTGLKAAYERSRSTR